jgi:hypothetical protein
MLLLFLLLDDFDSIDTINFLKDQLEMASIQMRSKEFTRGEIRPIQPTVRDRARDRGGRQRERDLNSVRQERKSENRSIGKDRTM